MAVNSKHVEPGIESIAHQHFPGGHVGQSDICETEEERRGLEVEYEDGLQEI